MGLTFPVHVGGPAGVACGASQRGWGGSSRAAIEEEEEEQRRGPSASGVAPLQAPELVEGEPEWLGLCSGKGAREGGWEVPATEKARGKAPAVEPPPPEIDDEMAQHLQWEVEEAEQVWWGQDAATFVVVREAAGPLTRGQVEGLVGPS